MSWVYLDWNATTPPHPDVLEAMRRAELEAWANPASVHRPGQRARAELDRARAAVAALTGFEARDVVLTSGGTEANNLSLRSLLAGGGALVLSRLEHPSVTAVAEALAVANVEHATVENAGVEVAWVDPEPDGRVAPERFDEALSKLARRPLVACLQAVNHETGVLQPVAEVAALVHRAGGLLHVDAVQAAGKVEPFWQGADLLTIAGHKMRGPKGIGALARRPRVRIEPLLRGGGQERGLRPGTQGAAAAAGLAAAAERARETCASYALIARRRDRLERELLALGQRHRVGVTVNGTAPRVPHVTNLSWDGWRGPELCAALDLEGVAIASGSACSAGTAEPSPVIRAIAGERRAAGAVRMSLGDETSDADIEAVVAAFERVLGRRR